MLRRVCRETSAVSSKSVYWLAARNAVTVISMPALSPTTDFGAIQSWKIHKGDPIAEGTELAKVETDKATVGFNMVGEEGFFARALVEEGTANIKVGAPVALMVDTADEIDSDEVKNWKNDEAAPAAEEKQESAPEAKKAESKPAASKQRGDGERIMASPLARKTAAELDVDLSQVEGTGGSVGRIVKEDVVTASKSGATKSQASSNAQPSTTKSETAQPAKKDAPAPSAGGAAPATYEDKELSNMRKTIAKRLTASKNEVPHYYLTKDCKADDMLATIKHLNQKGDGKFKISVNDYIIKAIARANLLVPACNTHWHGDFLRQHKTVDVSVAVATDNGLITPIIKNAHVRGLADISIEMKELAKRAREGGLQPNEYQGGTVTLSNLGGMGIDSFTAIINNPHSMILAAGTLRPQAEIVTGEDGELKVSGKVENVISFTASFDHRVVDGAVGAEWFKHFKDAIENPLSLLL